MKKASNYAFLSKKVKPERQRAEMEQELNVVPPPAQVDLNVFVLSFEGSKEAQKNLAGGDPYECKKCTSVLNKFSIVKPASQVPSNIHQLKPNQSLWVCEFCNYPNKLLIEKQEIPVKEDVVYMIQSALEQEATDSDSTIIFCIDVSGSMNTTSEITGKVDLKFGLSKQEIEMLKQFMEPGDEAQFANLPGAHNQNKTYISRMQCVLSAIQSQINEIKKIDPYKKVGFILFNNQVLVLGDGKTENVSLVGDRLNNSNDILNALKNFKLTSTIAQSYELLLNQLNKTQAKGQTALGPALSAAIQVASKGNKGSTVVLCTDGLANIGIGALEGVDESKIAFYKDLGELAKARNVSVNIVTIKGQSSKLQVLGQVVEATNGNIKVVNPEKLSQDFANVLKDEIVGLNVSVKIMLHKALVFRNEDLAHLKDSKTILVKQFANATVNTKISFEYELRDEEDLKFMEINIEKLEKVPFQAQITYISPKGGKFLRIISSESKTTMERKDMEKQINIGVVHQRVASNTAQMFSRGQAMGSASYNNMWSDYLNNNFKAPQYQKQQEKFNMRNERLNQAISNKIRKEEMKMAPSFSMAEKIEEEEEEQKPGFFASIFSSKKKQAPRAKMVDKKSAPKQSKRRQSVDSDEDEMEFKNYMMEKNDDFE